jgi:mono/diheme cytochrome c family protein
MKKIQSILAGILFLISMSGCSLSLAADVTPPPNYQQPVVKTIEAPQASVPLSAPDITNGEAIYQEKCLACHGESGKGDGEQSVDLPVDVAQIGLFDFAKDKKPSDWYQIISVGNIDNFMPGFQSLSDSQRWDVTAYALTLSMEYEEAETSVLFENNCKSCHATGNANLNNDFSDFGSLAALSHAELVTKIAAGNSAGMPAFEDKLSEQDINALANYVRALGFTPTGEVSPLNSASDSQASETPQAAGTSGTAFSNFTIKGSILGLDEIPERLVVTLSAFDANGMLFQTDTTVDGKGSYSFPNLELVSGEVYQLAVVLDGVTYSSEVLHSPELNEQGEVELPIHVTATSTDASALYAERMHVFFDFVDQNTIQVVELFVINNPSNEVIIPVDDQSPIIEYALPEGFQNLQFEQGDFETRYIQTEKGFGDLQPYEADSSTQFIFAYELPYPNKLDLAIELPIPVEAAVLMLPSGSVKLTSEQLTFDGNRTVQDMNIQTYSSSDLTQEAALQLTLSGKIKLATQNQDNSTTNIVVGAAALVLALGVALIWFGMRSRNKKVEALEETEDDLDALLDAVIALDDANKNGEIPESAYQSRRAELVAKINAHRGEK